MGTSDLEPGGARVCRQLEGVLKLVLPQGLLVGVESKVKVKVNLLSPVRLFATPWTIAHQAPLSMGYSRQECWSGLPCPPPGGLPNSGIQPGTPALQADSLPCEPLGNCLQCRTPGLDPRVRKVSWRREWLPTPVILPGEFHGQRSLVGYGPWGSQSQTWLSH